MCSLKFNLDGFKKAFNFMRPSEDDVSMSEYEDIDSNVEEFHQEDLDEKIDVSIPEAELTDSI